MSTDTPRWVAVARILRARGNKGEVAAELLTDFPERLTKLREIFLSSAETAAEPQRASLVSAWFNKNHPGQIVFHFEGINSISEAERLRNRYVFLPVEQRVTLPAGHYFVSDLMGCSVFETASARNAVASSPCSLAEAPALLGTVREVQFFGENIAGVPILAVDTSPGELLIPLAEDICVRIDTAARRIDVILPEGLRELNSTANNA